MASDKKRYTVNGVRYNIPKDEVKGFLKSNPNAIPVNSYMHNDSIYHVPMNDLDGFLQAKPDAKLVEGSKKKVSTPAGGPGRASFGLGSTPESSSQIQRITADLPLSATGRVVDNAITTLGQFLEINQAVPDDLGFYPGINRDMGLTQDEVDKYTYIVRNNKLAGEPQAAADFDIKPVLEKTKRQIELEEMDRGDKAREYLQTRVFDESVSGKLIKPVIGKIVGISKDERMHLDELARMAADIDPETGEAADYAYDANMVQRVAGGLLAIMADMPIFGGIGAAVKLPTAAFGRLVGAGMSKIGASKGVVTALTNIASSSPQMAAVLGGHAALNELSEQVINEGKVFGEDPDNGGVDWDPVVRTGGRMAAVGAAVGPVGSGTRILSNSPKITGVINNAIVREATKAGINAAGLVAESAIFAYGDALIDRERSLSDVSVKDFLESLLTIFGLKAMHLPSRVKTRQSRNMTKTELQAVEKYVDTGPEAKPVMEQLKSDKGKLDALMNDPNVTWEVKAEVANQINGVNPLLWEPVLNRVDLIETPEGIHRLTSYDKNGNKISIREFQTKTPAMKEYRIQEQVMLENNAMINISRADVKSLEAVDKALIDIGYPEGLSDPVFADAISTPKQNRTAKQNAVVEDLIDASGKIKVEEQIKEAEAKREEARGDIELKIEKTKDGKFVVRQEGNKVAPEFETDAEAKTFVENFQALTGKGMEFKEKKRLDAEDVAAGKKEKIEPTVTKVEKDAVQEPKAKKVDVGEPTQPGKEVGKEKPQAEEEVKPQELAKEYNERISKVKEETPDQMWSVDKPSEADIVEAARGDRIVKGDGGMVMVKPDGDIVGLFKDTPGKKGVADQLIKDAVAKGGTKLDNFDGYLTKIYERNGFRVASRIPFDPAQAPKDMPASEAAKKPDVVFMVNDPAGKIPAEQLNRKFESYEDAMKYRDAMVPEMGTGKQNEAFFTEKAAKASSDVPYEPVINIDKETPTAKAYDTYSAGGNFTGHISKMIPGFQEKQIRVAEAINKTGAKSFLDIGASEGGLAKTVGSQNPDMRVVAVDPNSQMKKNFESTPEVKNVEFRQEAFQGSWTEADGTKINEFKPKEKFDVINEDFTFQFVNADRAKQVAGVKEMLAEDGVFITSEKFHTANKKANEAKKAEHQKKYFTEQERTADAEGIVTGMAKDMVKDVEYFEILKDNFKHVEEFWNAGEFKGFVASDSRPALEKFKKGVGDLTTEFTDPASQTAAGAPPAKVPPKPPKPPEKPGELPGPEGNPERDVMESLKEMRKERKAAMKSRKEIASNRPSYLWYDQQEPFKRDVLGKAKKAGRGKLEAQRVSDRLNTEKGAKARTAMEFARDLKEITGGIRGIGPKEMDLVSDIIDMRRTQELYKSREAFGKEELLMEGGITLKQAEDFLTRVKKKDPAILEEYGLKDYDPKKLRKASEVVNRKYRDILDELLAEGIIRQEAYDQITFEHPFYSPRKFFSAMDKMDPGGSMSGIESLKGGSEGAKMVDAPSLYFDALSRKNAMVARTRTMRAIENYIKEVAPENMKLAEYTPEFLEKMSKAKEGDPWIEPQFKDAPKGMEAVDYIDINGNRKRVFMDAEVHKYFQVEPYGDMTRKIMNWAGWISGTKPLKMAATGYNPEFMIKNVPIDIAHILMTTDIYSPILPVGVAQIHADMAKVAKDMVNRKGVYVDYINEGGGMKMLTGQGRLREGVSRQKLKKTTQAAEAIEGWAAWMGESSELLTRLSVRQRHLDKARSRFIKENGREPSAKEQKELQLDATAYARNYLDFEQGGRVIKMADSVIPYLNAGFQVTRGSLRAAGKNPGLYAAKVAQLAGTAAAITAWNMGMIQTDNIDEEKGAEMRRFYLNDISDEVKARNFVMMTPMKYIDANGVEKYVYFKFQKDNLQELITGVAEDRVHREVMGDLGPSYLSPRRIKELQVATESFANVSQLPPAVRGMLGYKLNKDFFYNSDLWMGYDMGRDKSLEYRRDTPERYKFVGKIPLPGGHKLSPTRSHYVAKQFFTESNVISTGIGELMDYAIRGASPEMTTEYTPGEVEKLKNAPFARRFLKSTYPGASKQGSDTYQQQYNRIKQDNNLALDNLIDSEAPDTEVYDWINSIYEDGDGDITYIKEGDRLTRRYQEEVLKPAVNSWVERLKYIDAVPRAQELFDQWVHMDDTMRDHLLESAVMAGVLSDDVIIKFEQLQQEYESEYQKMEAERSKEQPETKKPRPKRSSFAPDLPSVKDVKGVDVEIDVEIEETGKTERMSMSAVEVRKDIKRRYDAINELIKSIG
jgi:SAM-dependent methyltransferase